MSDEKATNKKENIAGRLTGKTTTHTVEMLITSPKVGRNNYLVVYDNIEEEDNYFLLSITDMWSDSSGLKANLQVLGDRPNRPFEVGSEVYLADEEQISKVLGIYNPPGESISIGKLLGYPFNVNILVKNLGRIFITGKSGSGKSYTMGVLCEEFLKKGIPVVILDRHGEYGSLKVAAEDLDEQKEEEPESFKSDTSFCPWCGSEISKEATECENCGKSLEAGISEDVGDEKPSQESDPGVSEFVDNIIEYADLSINSAADVDLEYIFSLDPTDIVAPRLCSIVNLRGLDLEVQQVIASKLLKKLYTASTSRQIPPFYLFLDEAHLFAGKKTSEARETVKLFAQEGRKFGANIVIGTQRPQLLDTTIRAQAGTWVVHNLSDVRDIGITIQSAEDLSKENSNDISGLDKGESIISGEAVRGIPLFVKVRKRRTQHGGIGFNPLDFLSEETVEVLQKRRDKLLSKKSKEELEVGKSMFQDLMEPKSITDYQEEIIQLKTRVKELENKVESLKKELSESEKTAAITSGSKHESAAIKELKTELQVWKEKYNFLKQKSEDRIPQAPQTDDKKLRELSNKISQLEGQINHWKKQYEAAKKLAEKSIKELKKKKK
ncbi:MAG: DUF87 domain-containing protein [Candidatus Lokiarchaeota archaeon]|nr:DUF87 domain-containing protein [Candidatus Lokiarchaeota archaeon]MBD3339379.1 DUF87 domain-containing protein [Candidatus Lokiarchaeota archaeon]